MDGWMDGKENSERGLEGCAVCLEWMDEVVAKRSLERMLGSKEAYACARDGRA